MTKYRADLTVLSSTDVAQDFTLLRVSTHDIDPVIAPGQFAELRTVTPTGNLLRRPISIHDYDPKAHVLSFLIRRVGDATKAICRLRPGDKLDTVFPLGNGFPLDKAGNRPLLVGGGVGVAPLMLLAKQLISLGASPVCAFGAKTESELLLIDEFSRLCPVHISTDDGSKGIKGFVSDLPLFSPSELSSFSSVMVCGPTPMMKAVNNRVASSSIDCFVSLETMMACGIGVCLCCVTDTQEGNLRVCTDGPVFNTKSLKW
jgi:dihydroorotate dehydrogenase electron transfer subunit